MLGEIIFLFIISFFIRKKFFDKGKIGEKKVAKQLERLDRNKYKVINNVILKTSRGTSQIDHLVISQYGIFVLESKNYTGWIFGSERADKWQQIIYKKKSFFRNPIKQNYSHIKALEENLPFYSDVKYISIIVFMYRCDLKVSSTTPVIYVSDLMDEIYKHKKVFLSEEEVNNIYRSILKLNVNSKLMSKKHVKNIKKQLKFENEKISNNICPRCGKRLVYKLGKNGVYLGCTGYPKCRFIKLY